MICGIYDFRNLLLITDYWSSEKKCINKMNSPLTTTKERIKVEITLFLVKNRGSG